MSEIGSVDRTDLGILSVLAKNARISNKELASAVGLAPSSCHQRLKALRQKKVLLGSYAEVDFCALGLPIEALVFVQLKNMRARQVNRYLEKTATITEIRSVFLVSGHFDLVAHVAVRSMEHLKQLISHHFRQPFVMRTETSVVFNRLMHHALPNAESEA
jgi:DNA-binding Lrp family transcriptional regulator